MALCGPQEGSLGLEGQWAWVPVAVVRGGALQGESQKGVGRLLLLDRAMLIITPDCEPSWLWPLRTLAVLVVVLLGTPWRVASGLPACGRVRTTHAHISSDCCTVLHLKSVFQDFFQIHRTFFQLLNTLFCGCSVYFISSLLGNIGLYSG